MKLIRGSYAYIIGLMILGAGSILSLVAFCFALFTHTGEENPLLSAFGGKVADGVVSTICAGVFVLWSGVCSVMTLFYALKKNSLDLPLRFIAVSLCAYAGVLAFLSLFYRSPGEEAYLLILRLIKCLPVLLLGFFLWRLTGNRPQYKLPSLVLCALCALLTFFGYGFQNAFGYEGDAPQAAIYAYVSLLLFSISLSLFFLGLGCFIGGTEKRKKRINS